MIRTVAKSPDDTRELAAAIASLSRAGDVVLLAGDLGAGKTTFVQGFGRALGVEERITSPTFTLVNHYEAKAMTVLHADVYRLDNLQEVIDLGLIELVDDDAVALVEWGDMAEPVLPQDFLEIRIAYPEAEESSDELRTFTLRPVGASWAARTKALEVAVERWVDR